jgi:hypothetical protein
MYFINYLKYVIVLSAARRRGAEGHAAVREELACLYSDAANYATNQSVGAGA